MAVFLVVSLLGVHFWFVRAAESETKGILGGPAPSQGTPGPLSELTTLTGEAVISSGETPLAIIPPTDSYAPSFLVAALKDQEVAANAGAGLPGGVITYKVKKGDTLSKIAVLYGTSPESIRNTNPNLKTRTLRVGEEITILPISGVLYRLGENDSLDSIAASFGVSEEKIQEANPTVNVAFLGSGDSLVVPGVAPKGNIERASASLASARNYFTLPAKGYNWGILHNHNAVDIANGCGTAVVASAEGVVIPDLSFGVGTDNWNGGYGHFVLVEHPNGMKTRYAHLDRIVVTEGDYISQGEQIGTMGNTGNTHGPTGCHLHFEVYDAPNPFAR